MLQSMPAHTDAMPLSNDEQSELELHETEMDRCRDEFMIHLTAIHNKKLYRSFGSFEAYCQQRWGYTADYARKLIRSSEVIKNLESNTMVSVLPTNERQTRSLGRLTPEAQPVVWQRAVETAPNGKVTAAHVAQIAREMYRDSADDELDPPMELEQVADQFPGELTKTDKELLRNSNPGVPAPEPQQQVVVRFTGYSSTNNEWYTPAHIIERVVSVFDGHISLDPCSNSSDPDEANVPALDYWTQADNGLAQPWHGRVYMNPPYGDEIGQWTDRLIQAHSSGEIDEAIALLPARTDTAWFQPLFDYTICFVRGRLRFSGAENSAPFPSVVVYLGPNIPVFADHFGDIGRIK